MRFTLKTLMAAVVATCVASGLFFTVPAIVAIPLLMIGVLFAPPVLISGIVYFRGYGRAFCIGCLCAGGCSPLLYYMVVMAMFGDGDVLESGFDGESELAAKMTFAAVLAFTVMSGLSSVAVRWMALRAQPSDNRPPQPSPVPYTILEGRMSRPDSRLSEPLPPRSREPLAETTQVGEQG